jgi:DNA-binding NtrC family response regulator
VGIFTKSPDYFPMPVILIVDDEALIRWSVAETLEAAGYQPVEAASAGEALRQFDTTRDISLVVLDLKLPDSNDLGLLRQIRQIAPNCRIIVMTAHGTPDVLDEARRLGACGVLEKPFDLGRFVDVVEHALQPA